jgi:hypothetical protein
MHNMPIHMPERRHHWNCHLDSHSGLQPVGDNIGQGLAAAGVVAAHPDWNSQNLQVTAHFLLAAPALLRPLKASSPWSRQLFEFETFQSRPVLG